MRSKHTSKSLRIALGASIVLHLAIFIAAPIDKQQPIAPPETLEVSIQTSEPNSVDDSVEEIPAPLRERRPVIANERTNTPGNIDIAERISTDTLSNTTKGSALDLSRDALSVVPTNTDSSSREDELLAFRPEYKAVLHSRNIAKARTARIALNQAQRNGYTEQVLLESEEGTQAFDTITKIGNSCYSEITSSLPNLSINRGTRVGEVDCPGLRPWWERDDLSNLALHRNGYN